MTDRFANTQPSLSGPAASGFAITPSDSASLTEATRALYIGAAGDLTVRMLSGEILTLQNVPAGAILPLRTIAVMATGTTAGAIAALV
jgi:hypothetical protein